MNEIVSLTDAYAFAAARHVGQKRKGAAKEPYVNHLAEVAQLAARATGGADVELVMAAVLHDTVEDTATTFAKLEARFGPRVAALVGEVTDDKKLPKAERKALQIAHAPGASPAAKVIKLADKTSNLRSLAGSPPQDWPQERLEDYLTWAQKVVAGVRGTNAWLEARFDEAVKAAQLALAERARAPA